MTPQEFYDNLMEVIHQFPLEANNYERESRRTRMAYNRLLIKFRKIMDNVSEVKDKKFIRLKRRLENLIDKRRRQVIAFEECINKHLVTIQDYCNISEEPIVFSLPPETKCSILKVDESSVSMTKYCICNDKASGTMIRCENPSCPIKWFHFKCIGLVVPPKVEWMCIDCRKESIIS